MRRWILVIFCLLLLAGCGGAPRAAPAGGEDEASDAVSLPVTEEAIRAAYEAEGAAVLKIPSYEGDFLVELGPEERPALDWVFGTTGIRRRLYTGFSGIRMRLRRSASVAGSGFLLIVGMVSCHPVSSAEQSRSASFFASIKATNDINFRKSLSIESSSFARKWLI